MTHWTTRPTTRSAIAPIPILRILPGKPVTAIVTSHDAEGAELHYWKGRSTPCNFPDCAACDAHHAPRWYGYLAIWNPTNNQRALVELTAACAAALDAWVDVHGTTRGAQLTLSRANKKPNSRLALTLTPSNYTNHKIPEPPNVRHQLEKMWERATQPSAETPAHLDLPPDRITPENGRYTG